VFPNDLLLARVHKFSARPIDVSLVDLRVIEGGVSGPGGGHLIHGARGGGKNRGRSVSREHHYRDKVNRATEAMVGIDDFKAIISTDQICLINILVNFKGFISLYKLFI